MSKERAIGDGAEFFSYPNNDATSWLLRIFVIHEKS
jgi:hypothetical protein